MRKQQVKMLVILSGAVLVVWPLPARAQGSFQIVSGKAFDSAIPTQFYLEGNAIPTEKRNAALLKIPSGARLLLALIDTAGYSSQIKQKYIGMMISEAQVSVCGSALGVGSYGFGLDPPAATSSAEAKFHVYNQAGAEVASCAASKDNSIKPPRPLHVALSGGSAWLELGHYKVEIKP